MPTIDSTIGGGSANSYQELSVADSYFSERLNVTAWQDAGADDRGKALIMAARRLNSENWIGERAATTQKLAWPRIGAVKPDSSGGGIGYYYGGFEAYAETEIPELVTQAQCELALALLDGFDDGADAIAEWKADDVQIKYQQTRPDGELPASVVRLIAPLLSASIQLVRA